MKLPTLTPIRSFGLIRALAIFMMLAGPLMAQAQKIESRPLSPREIKLNGLPQETMTSGGLLVVGIGESVYLEAQVTKGTVTGAVTWTVESRPLGGSVAGFLPTPILPDMPIHSLGDREINQVAGRTHFIPDLPGKYQIKAVVATDGDPITLEAQVTGAYYTGIGTMANATPRYPQCALCHPSHALSFMETEHAIAFEKQIDGAGSSHFNENCNSCHNLGKGKGDVSGSFFEVALDAGWTFPETLQPGNWDAIPAEVQAMANVQCEHCHGAGSEHHGDFTTTAVSLAAGDCGQCHDAEPYHTKNMEWELSRHAVATRYPTGENRAACVACHSGVGFIDSIKAVGNVRTSYEAITCAVCHDPHSAENPAQLRTIDDVVLRNGHEVTAGGTGKLCMNCHKSRVDGEVFATKYAARFSPHGSVQTDMLVGTNAVEFGKKIRSTAHIHATEDACSTCHMASAPAGDPARHMAGGHTFKLVFDGGTPDDPSDDVDMVSACVTCHGPMDSFDMPRMDFNFDGITEGVQTEVKHLLNALARKLPPIGEPRIQVSQDFTTVQLQAAFNHIFVTNDGSYGIHNTQYAVGLLQEAITQVSDPFNAVFNGLNIPMGGEWFFSPWFDFYAPGEAEGWIYHFHHGHLYVLPGADGSIWVWEDRGQWWWFTSPSTYPVIYSPQDGSWLYFAGTRRANRLFYNYASSDWIIIE